jgi:hypothetical protein
MLWQLVKIESHDRPITIGERMERRIRHTPVLQVFCGKSMHTPGGAGDT